MGSLRFASILMAGTLLAMSAQAQSGADQQALCQAAGTDGALETAVDRLMEQGRFSYGMAPALLTLDCDGTTLIQKLINEGRAENLEFAVIDLGIDVNRPLVPVEAGELSVVQYLMQQAVLAPSAEAREFSLEYMHDLRSVDFNPNLQLVTMK